jgi:transposase-like protein
MPRRGNNSATRCAAREALGAEKGERASGRQGYWSGYYGRTLITP